ncbi:LysE family translocator [Rhizorhabdus wittichii]|uniref:Lysine exporter protein (LYSE/YGGA) n=2 Tax=Rhizorhabdus wittichii TaxID=160791 RepID=A0A9J9HF10_RHIWR|nr:LysE family translocator [Rhizorhabdus wittichii]ABQ70254.1 Lysine exporter protein (LYSE/YGGA) [Rhizorhabdus wittichii RW1]ARR52791.1 amino acid transporter [Rhizorhabdus wittichii DC-6]QTH24195.1 LysE family translocator [Rhizorhabdus wittichii]
MPLHSWWLFVCATFVISAIPGPNMLHVMTQSMRHGFRRAFFTMAGCLLALLGLFGLSAMGMSALIAAVPQLLTVIKVVGAAYLIWIGIKAWRDDSPPIDIDAGAAELHGRTAGELFRAGMLISLSNPKALIFAAAFFPQFVSPALPKAPQFAVLLATFVVIEGGWYLTYATGGRTLARYLRRAEWQRQVGRVSGALFVLFGLSLLAWRER